MASITLAKALKLKKRLVEKIHGVEGDINKFNRIISGNEREVDIQKLIYSRDYMIGLLIDLKVKIFEAGSAIRAEIFRLSELKSDITFYRAISTDKGKSYNYDGNCIEYDVVVNKAFVDSIVSKNEAEIDRIQFDVIDKHNNTSFITIDFDINAL